MNTGNRGLAPVLAATRTNTTDTQSPNASPALADATPADGQPSADPAGILKMAAIPTGGGAMDTAPGPGAGAQTPTLDLANAPEPMPLDAAAAQAVSAQQLAALVAAAASSAGQESSVPPRPTVVPPPPGGPVSYGRNALVTDPQIIVQAPAGPSPTAAQAATLNVIALENLTPGTPESVWRSATLNPNIEGFATQISVNHGQTVNFKIDTNSRNYRIDIYRLGYYGGDGARLVTTIQRQLGAAQVQPAPIVDQALGLVDAGNWGVSASWNVPADAVSGLYLAKLVRQDGTAGINEIPFIVRDDEAHSDIVFQTSDTTWQAYNPWGGSNFYGTNVGAPGGRAYKVSYNRPISTENGGLAAGPQDYIFGAEYPAIRWLEQNGYDVSYIAGVDAARSGARLLDHRAFLSVGHDEYWSGEQRANVEAARDAGVNLTFWSGNEVYWKTRWENSIDGSGTPFRTLVCYKETWANTGIDPSSTSTGTWRDARFLDPGQKPENALTGTIFQVDSYRADTISVPYDMSQFRFWRNTSISDLQQGQTGALVTGLLGYEWDSDVDNGFRPAGLVDLSLSTVAVNTYLFDYGSTIGNNTATHSLTMYRANSGALVFGAGTVYWSWGLDSHHDNEQVATDPNVRQAMVNLFADMGVQPDTLDASLALANASTDTAAPTSTVTGVSSGGNYTEGQAITVTGTAQDSGGGKIAGVEVSLDSGANWHKVTGFNNWSYSGRVEVAGNYTVRSRAVDDSLNRQPTPTTGRPITVAPPAGSTLWTFADKPADVASEFVEDSGSLELGTRFQASAAGTITGIRFYKSFLNQGTHTGHLWTAGGTLLATATFTNETPSGWQIATFAQPVAINANTTYVASYHTGNRYSASTGYFNVARTRGQLTAPVGAGVFRYGSGAIFPNSTFQNENYWVDPLFAPSTGNRPPVAANDSGFSTPQSTALTITAAALLTNDSDPDGDPLSINGVSNFSNGTATLNAQAQMVTFTPNTGYIGPASFTYTIGDGRGGTASASVSLSVNSGGGGTGVSLFSPSATPATITENDPNPVELGMKFRASSAGTISGIRFYKGPQNTGAHQAHLWSSTGTLLATATFANETASGWQTATFASPVSIAANTTYIASYHSNGFYSANANYFASAVTNGPLTGLASGSSGGNGVYIYGASGLFPNATYNASNYWVDTVYNQGTATNRNPVAVNDSGFSTAQNTPVTIQASALLANDSDPDSDPLSITGVSNFSNGNATLNTQAQTVTFTPNSGYIGPAQFTYAISDGRGGAASANVSLTVNAAGQTPVSLFSLSDTPATLTVNDPNPVELGMRFRSDVAGAITALRFYKGPQNTGAHEGHLWNANGTLLATVTFTDETASGWQTANLNTPVAISANTNYIASYHSNGRYSASGNYFAAERISGPLHAPTSTATSGNGVYAYGGSGLFPSNTFNRTNYWVDVAFNGQLAA